jgi:3-dehydroquinate synthase
MEVSRVSDTLEIQSHKGPYRVHFDERAVARIATEAGMPLHVIIDRRVAELHGELLAPLLSGASVLAIDALEANKSLEAIPAYVTHLVSKGIRRDHRLVAIGGGIIQDITCFLAGNILRGVDWVMVPTTLLAQADSCIGSKSSINCGGTKNILGTFTPPKEVWIASRFLETLAEHDVRSGVGEMLKVHAIDGPTSFDRIAADYEKILSDRTTLLAYVRRSLEIKQHYIEVDEFDRGPRLVFNFGHSFGHAIEAATNFAIPHGIAVTIGMDMALEVGQGLGKTNSETVTRMRPVLRRNAHGYRTVPVPQAAFLTALSKDKKNTGAGAVTVILPMGEGRIERVTIPMDMKIRDICAHYFESLND